MAQSPANPDADSREPRVAPLGALTTSSRSSAPALRDIAPVPDAAAHTRQSMGLYVAALEELHDRASATGDLRLRFDVLKALLAIGGLAWRQTRGGRVLEAAAGEPIALDFSALTDEELKRRLGRTDVQ